MVVLLGPKERLTELLLWLEMLLVRILIASIPSSFAPAGRLADSRCSVLHLLILLNDVPVIDLLELLSRFG